MMVYTAVLVVWPSCIPITVHSAIWRGPIQIVRRTACIIVAEIMVAHPTMVELRSAYAVTAAVQH
eukprot:COSAG01_NODE_25025_length_758_cov_0.987860_2_plen_64_part_01